jgi:type III pantothenate kinase
MNDRSLVLDVGNTRVKWGVSDGGRIVRTGSAMREALKSSGFSALTTRLPRRVNAVLVSNVAGPGFGARLSSVVGIHCDQEVHFAHPERQAFGITSAYRQPRRLGVDRWVAMIGARSEFKGALCVVDAGTAMTIDALDSSGQHLGGQIMPGLELMAVALERDTSDIGAPSKSAKDMRKGMGMFAGSTRQAVQAGSLNAVCGAIERAVRVMRSAGYRPQIVLTGGDASRILKQLDGKILHRPHLVLQGLAFMLQGR